MTVPEKPKSASVLGSLREALAAAGRDDQQKASQDGPPANQPTAAPEKPKSGSFLGSLREALAAAGRDDLQKLVAEAPTAPLLDHSAVVAKTASETSLSAPPLSHSKARVFISYRRDDSRWQARQIYDGIAGVLPRQHLFMDIDSIPPGADFVHVLEGWVDKCNVLLALIGKDWIGATDLRSGQRRLDDENDFVRIEIREALARQIAVVPILLDDTPMPRAEELPSDIALLARRQAEVMRFATFTDDLQRLLRRLGLASTTDR